eukprot:jgi/Hompol1/6665/HPOL_001289-RA
MYQTMVGTNVAPSMNLVGINGTEGIYFIFFDLSIRTEGHYRLKFSLCDLMANGLSTRGSPQLASKAAIIDEVFSDVFHVMTPTQFGCAMESTELTKAFARQGIKLPIRNSTTRLRRSLLAKSAMQSPAALYE